MFYVLDDGYVVYWVFVVCGYVFVMILTIGTPWGGSQVKSKSQNKSKSQQKSTFSLLPKK